ncbi:MAG: hypothetical protein NWP79_12095, partial [Paracoccaceae bacterium]|nr:hypothetical protein [Paracoccaceae bacterium]
MEPNKTSVAESADPVRYQPLICAKAVARGIFYFLSHILGVVTFLTRYIVLIKTTAGMPHWLFPPDR